jgi:glycosyltransferase involved in cell wall biosynthesis
MKVKIIESESGNTFNIDGTAKGAMGGTELMMAGLKKYVDPALLDKFQIIASRVSELDPNKKAIFWAHDLAMDPAVAKFKDAEFRKQFAQLIFVSNYQFQSYNQLLGVPYQKSLIMRNAIEPIMDIDKPNPKDRINLIYHTTPHRGLELLLPVFEELLKQFPQLHLDVYSSFRLYNWPERDVPYQFLFDKCREHPNITYHGAVANDEIRKALGKAHIFAYPSIWPETSCLAAIEAMSANVVVVCPDLAALCETVGDFGYCYRWDEDPQTHLNRFYATTLAAINNLDSQSTKNLLLNAKGRTDVVFNWEARGKQWTTLLENL